MPLKGDFRDIYRGEYNQMMIEKSSGANGIIQEKYVTLSVFRKDIEEARSYFTRVGASLTARLADLGSRCVELDAVEKLRILHDFYRPGEENRFQLDLKEMVRLGEDFRDYRRGFPGLYLSGQHGTVQRLSETGRNLLPGAVLKALRFFYSGQYRGVFNRYSPEPDVVH